MSLTVPSIYGGGVKDYNKLSNIPSINGVALVGNKTSADLNIESGGTVIQEDVTEKFSVWGGNFTPSIIAVSAIKYGELRQLQFEISIPVGSYTDNNYTNFNTYDYDISIFAITRTTLGDYQVNSGGILGSFYFCFTKSKTISTPVSVHYDTPLFIPYSAIIN